MQLEGEGKLSLPVSSHCSEINPKHLTETTKILKTVTAPAEFEWDPFRTQERHTVTQADWLGTVIRCEILSPHCRTERGFKLQTLYTFNSSF